MTLEAKETGMNADLREDEFVFVHIKSFKDKDAMKGKSIALAVSFSWIDCLDGSISKDAPLGLNVTLRDKRIVPHQFYVEAFVDLVSRHNFRQVKFILAGQLQWYNLMLARGFNPLDENNENEKKKALSDLLTLEKAWIDRFRSMIYGKLDGTGTEVVFAHWKDLLEQTDPEYKASFHNLKQGSAIAASYDKEVKAACKREENKGRNLDPQAVHAYLGEEIPVFLHQVSPRNPDKINYFLYPAKVDVMIDTFNAMGPGHGLWETINVSIKDNQYLINKAQNKNISNSCAEGMARKLSYEQQRLPEFLDDQQSSSSNSVSSLPDKQEVSVMSLEQEQSNCSNSPGKLPHSNYSAFSKNSFFTGSSHSNSEINEDLFKDSRLHINLSLQQKAWLVMNHVTQVTSMLIGSQAMNGSNSNSWDPTKFLSVLTEFDEKIKDCINETPMRSSMSAPYPF